MCRDVLLKICIVAALILVGIFVMQTKEPFASPPLLVKDANGKTVAQDYYVNTKSVSEQTLNISSLPSDVRDLYDIVYFTYNGSAWVPFTSQVIGRYVDPGTGGISYTINSPKTSATVLKKPKVTTPLLKTQVRMPISTTTITKGITIKGLGNVSSIASKVPSNTKTNLVVRLVFKDPAPTTLPA